jgi:hypothetical protein
MEILDLAKLFLIFLVNSSANNLLTVLQLNLDLFVTLLPLLVFLISANLIQIVWEPTTILTFGTIANLPLLMDKRLVFQKINALLMLLVTITIHALKMFVSLITVSAEMFNFVTITMNVLKILLLLLLMENLALVLILQFLAHKIQLFLTKTLSYFLMMTNKNGSENATKIKDVSLVSLMLNVTIIMVAQPTLANNNIASTNTSPITEDNPTHGVILNWLLNQLPSKVFQD